MSGMSEIYLGLILGVMGLTGKVIVDGLRTFTDLHQNIELVRSVTEQCRMKKHVEEENARELEETVEALKDEIRHLDVKEQDIVNQIKVLRVELDGTGPKFKADNS